MLQFVDRGFDRGMGPSRFGIAGGGFPLPVRFAAAAFFVHHRHFGDIAQGRQDAGRPIPFVQAEDADPPELRADPFGQRNDAFPVAAGPLDLPVQLVAQPVHRDGDRHAEFDRPTGLALRYPPRVRLVHREDLIPVRNQVSVDQAGADMARKLSRHSAVSPDRPDSRPLGGQNRFRQIKKSLPHPLDQRSGLLQQVPDLRGAVNACPAEPPRQPAGAVPELGLQMLVLPPAFDVPAGAQPAGLAHRAAHRFGKQTVVDRMFDIGLHNKRIRFHIDRTAVPHDPVTELHDFIVDEPKRILVEKLRQIVRDPGRLELIMIIRTLQHDPDFGMPAHLLKAVEVAVEPLFQNARAGTCRKLMPGRPFSRLARSECFASM